MLLKSIIHLHFMKLLKLDLQITFMDPTRTYLPSIILLACSKAQVEPFLNINLF